MSEGIKLAMVGIVCFTLLLLGILLKDHFWSKQQTEMRLAACANSDSVACALAVKR